MSGDERQLAFLLQKERHFVRTSVFAIVQTDGGRIVKLPLSLFDEPASLILSRINNLLQQTETKGSIRSAHLEKQENALDRI